MDIFRKETDKVLNDWDGHIYMRSVKGKLDWMELTRPLPCGDAFIPSGYEWNGASVGPIRHIPIVAFPKWRHPIATCRHDYRCQHAQTREQRKISDELFKSVISLGQSNKFKSWWEETKGFVGVRIGAIFFKKGD